MKKIGLTGNIASGKTTVENIIADMGYKVIDADYICHGILDSNTDIIKKITEVFSGYDVLDDDGKIDRIKLGKIVFSSPKYKSMLEQILHPPVISEIEDFFQNNMNEKAVFASVPLLFEAKMENLFDYIVYVSADENIRIERLMKRNSLSKSDALMRILAQDKDSAKINKSDFIIYNNGSIDELTKNTNIVLTAISEKVN